MIMSLCYRAELPKSLSRAAGVRELGALGDPEGSGVWDAACRARCCDTPAPSPASRGGAPGRMRRWPTHNRENLHLQDKFTVEVVMI